MVDFFIDETGELSIDINGSINTCDNEDLRKQMALCRIKSISKDWHEAHIGSDIEEFLGKPADAATLSELDSRIKNALCFDGYFKEDKVYINTFLVESNYVRIIVYIQTLDNSGSFYIDVHLDLVKGVNVSMGG